MLWEGFLLTQRRGKWAAFVRVNKGAVWDGGTAADGVVWGVICSSFPLGGNAGCNQSLWPSGWHASFIRPGSWYSRWLHTPSTSLDSVLFAWDCLSKTGISRQTCACAHVRAGNWRVKSLTPVLDLALKPPQNMLFVTDKQWDALLWQLLWYMMQPGAVKIFSLKETASSMLHRKSWETCQ